MLRNSLLALGLLGFVGGVFAAEIRDAAFLDRLQEGQKAIYQLKFSEAEATFNRLIQAYPDEPAGYAFLALTGWNQLLQASGNLVLDDYATPTPFAESRSYKSVEKEQRRFKSSCDNLLQVCDRRLLRNPEDIEALYFKGFVYETFAAEAVAINKATGVALSYGKKASRLHEKVLQLDESFVDAHLCLATSDFARASLPWSIKWLAFLLGIRGNREAALEKLNLVSEAGKYRRWDAQIVLALLQIWKGDERKGVRVLERLAAQFPENYLFDLQIAAVYEGKLKDLRKALEVYERLAQDLPSKTPGLGAGEVFLRIGRTLFKLREYSPAADAFLRALQESPVEKETQPLSNFYLGQIHEEQGSAEKATFHYRRVLEYSGPQGFLAREIKIARNKVDN